MKYQILLVVALAFVVGCGGAGQDVADAPAEPAAGPAIKLEVETPEPTPVPEYVEPESDTDWVARINNKDKEIVEVLNIITPIAAYITVGFGCTGGRHRSVAVVETLAKTLRETGREVNVDHRDSEKSQ